MFGMKARPQGPCLVCGGAAVGVNFGVQTCAPCKAFFRRNAVKLGKIDFVCQADGDCPVTFQSRRMCNCCRLAKCFRVGMKKALIRSEEEREARRILIIRNRQQRSQQSFHQNFDFIQSNSMLPFVHPQADLLSHIDQMLISHVFNAYERTCQRTKSIDFENLFHSTEQLTFSRFFNQYSTMHISLIEYLKLIPEFHQLSIEDKIRLMKNHFLENLTIHLSILYPTLPQRMFTCFGRYFPSDVTQSIQFYLNDPILLKILLIIVTLSSSISRSCPSLDSDDNYENTLSIFAAQNLYVEILWRYVVSMVSSDDEAVKFFHKLFLFLLLLQRMTLIVDEKISNSRDEIEQMEPLMRNMWPQSAESLRDAS